MEKMLKLYTYVDGTNDTPFPSADEQVIIGSFTYTANRMGSAPQITATVMHRLCLDDLWNDNVYAEFNGEKYFVINTPSSSKSNDDTRYEHDLELLSEREILNHVYFIDAVQGDSDTDVYKSNSTKVLFFGDIQQFVARLNASLSYRNLGYTAVIDDGITSEDKQVSFEDKYILEALQEEFNIFEIPYYFVGKVIHFGYTSNAITTTFKYGHDDAFLSISKDNANYALINRITGVGSSDNIPYYYPNETDDQSAVEASGKKWITPSQNLMPSIYRESEGAEMFYEAKNNTYPDGEGGYYQFENEYSGTNPREGKTDFEDIKPTITGITNAAGQRIDMFSEFAYDTNDNDEVDEEGNYLHPYFFAKLRKTDGTYGFNLFDHAIESQTMQITFTSGICGACKFEIAVGDDTQKNLVQVGETSGALMRDEDGNVLCGREDLQQPQTPQDRQNDTKNYEVWIALRKDNSTYPQVMPNVNYNYKPSTSDTFAILGISLPQAYILKAEDELEKSLVKHMWMNNVEKFTFSAKFSRIFFTEHPEVLAQLNENARVIIEYNGKQHTLYIDNYSYKMDASSPLPEIDVDLVDTLSVGQNSLQTQLDSVKQDILSSIGGGDFLKTGLKYFLRKDTADTARGKITFVRGIDVGTFAENTSGGTFRVLEDLTTYAEVDRLRVRVKAYFETLEIINTNSVGGKMILTAGGGVYLREVKDRETLEDGTEQVWDFYRCYFLTEQDGREVENRFHVGDLAMSQSFNIKAGTHQGVTNHYYWREVVGVGDDYIDLSKSICDTGSDAPMAEDTVCHLGNRSDKDRQGAIIFSAVDVFSPSITLYYGINDFSLVNKDYVSYGVDKSTGNAFFRVYGEMYAGDREQTTYMKYTPEYGVEIRGKLLTQSGKDIENTLNSFQDQIDGVKETFYGEYTPTTSNSPANEWTTEEEKARHEGDVFTNIQEYVDDDTTPDAGKSWRWVKNDETGEWYWLQIADSDTSKAYFEAAKANQAAQDALDTVNAMQDTVEGMQNFTDTAFADGIVSRGEASSISAYIKNIETFAKDVSESYLKVYNNTLLKGTDKTNLGNAYTAFNTAKNELISTINGAIADGKVDSIEKSSVDGKYDAFNTKYGDFVAYLNAANKYIQDVINKNALDALDKIGEFDYLRAALKEYTSIEGGLIQSSTLALGYTSDDGYVVMAGTNGIYDSSKLGGGIASWWGGAMFDRFKYTEETMPENVASALVRMDGTGYFAKGNLWWESDGTLHADPLSFFVGEDSVGDVLGLFQFVKSDAGVEYVIPQHPFQKLEIGNYLQIGKAQLYWDEANQAFYVRHQDGVTPVGFYATGFVSAKGSNPESGSTVSGASALVDLSDVAISNPQDGQILSWNGTKWVNADAPSAGLDEAALAEYLTTNHYAKTTDIPSLEGYATQTWASGQFALKTVAINAGTGLTGGGTLAANRTLSLATVGTAGTYTKVTVDAYGRVTGHGSLSAGDIPALAISKITGLQDALDAKMDADDRADFLRFVDTVTTDSDTLYSAIGIRSFSGCYPDSLPVGMRWYNYGEAISFPVPNGMRFDLYANHHSSSSLSTYNRNGLMFRTGFHNNAINGWRMILDGTNYNGYVTTLDNLTHAVASDYIQVGSARLRYDSANNALYVQKSDGTQCGFYATGFVSTKGANSDAGSEVAGVTELSELEDVAISSPVNGQTLVYRNGVWKNEAIETGLTTVSWDDVTGKPKWIGSTKPTYTAAEVGALTQDTADGRYVRQNLGYIGNNADLDDYTGSGLYVVSASSYATIGNFPTESAYGYGTLVSLMFAEGRGVQWYIPDYSHPMAIRQAWTADEWQGWTYLLTHRNYSAYTVTKTGGGASGTWGIGITGNAGSATKLQTARTIALSGAVSGSTTFDGSAGVTVNTAFNAQSLLTSLKTVDGSGSGLDADLLDGYEATDFYHKKVANAVSVSKALSDLVAENGSADAWNSPSNSSLFLTNNNNALSFYVGGTQNERTANIQAGHSDARYYANILGTLYLNRLGGNVCIGNPDTTAHRLNVDGGICTDSYLQIGSARLRWDSANNALYVQKSDGTACGFYATGFVSAKGANDDGGDTEATVLTIADERNTAIYPDTYAGRGIRGLFRANATDGLNDGGTYHTVLHIRQWANSSGGLSHQLAFTDNGGVWHRTATSETAWGEWSELSALSGLGDVSLSSPTDGQALIYRDGVWKNETVNYGITMDVDWDDVKNKPAWIGSTKPSYSFSEITGTPSVTVSSSSSTNLSVSVEGSGRTVPSLYATYLGGTTKQGLFTGLTYSGNKLSVTVGGTTKSVTINAGGGSSLANVSDDSSGIVVKATSGTVVSIVGQSKPFYIDSQSGQTVGLRFEGNAETGVGVNIEAFKPLSAAAGKLYLGTSAARWRTIYSVNSLNTSSDLRLKDVRAAIPLTVAQVAAAPSFLYRWKKGADTALHAGSSAQYWRQALPQAVAEGADGYLAMEYDRIALAAAIATARAVETLDQRVTRLEKENARLRRRLRQHKINV